MLVNLGLIHRDNEVIPYWDGWLSWMRQQRVAALRVVRLGSGARHARRLAGPIGPSFEFVFHFNRSTAKPNKIVPCKHGARNRTCALTGRPRRCGKDGEVGGWTHAGQPTQDTRIPDSVIRVMRHKGKIGQDIDHPAVFPVALPEFAIEAYTDAGRRRVRALRRQWHDDAGRQRTGRVCRSVEIAPSTWTSPSSAFSRTTPACRSRSPPPGPVLRRGRHRTRPPLPDEVMA